MASPRIIHMGFRVSKDESMVPVIRHLQAQGQCITNFIGQQDLSRPLGQHSGEIAIWP